MRIVDSDSDGDTEPITLTPLPLPDLIRRYSVKERTVTPVDLSELYASFENCLDDSEVFTSTPHAVATHLSGEISNDDSLTYSVDGNSGYMNDSFASLERQISPRPRCKPRMSLSRPLSNNTPHSPPSAFNSSSSPIPSPCPSPSYPPSYSSYSPYPDNSTTSNKSPKTSLRPTKLDEPLRRLIATDLNTTPTPKTVWVVVSPPNITGSGPWATPLRVSSVGSGDDSPIKERLGLLTRLERSVSFGWSKASA